MSEDNQEFAADVVEAVTEADPAPTESEAGDGQETETERQEGGEDEEKVTLTKAELQELENKAYAKANAKAQRQLRRELAQSEARMAEQLQPRQPQKLERAQFDSDEAFAEARERQAIELHERTKAAQAEHKRAADFVNKASEIRGFDAAVFDTLTITDAMKDALLDADNGAKVLVYLTQNPDECDRIAEMGAVRQIRELAKLEAEISNRKPKQTNAPPVGTKLGGGETPNSNGYNPNLSQSQHEAWMKKSGSRWV